ncbi:unnamed protein product, partial [Rotaria sp. Silwood2]
MELQLFYNCTSPRFGPLCQYSFDNYEPYHSSLNEAIYDFDQHTYEPMNLTCYIHLECNHGSTLACLDWTEICDGHIDGLKDGIDEKNCWQLEINECEDNEYRCYNGQCVSKIFFHDDPHVYECLDRSDGSLNQGIVKNYLQCESTFVNEDVQCSLRNFPLIVMLTSSCALQRDTLLKKIVLLDRPNSLSETCWLAFQCIYNNLGTVKPNCTAFCSGNRCKQIINETCRDILFVPARPLIFGHMHVIFSKKAIIDGTYWLPSQYICYNDKLCGGGFYPNRTLSIFNNMTCRQMEDFPVTFSMFGRVEWIDYYFTNVSMSNSSKCISIHRLCGGMIDCDYKDDEQCSLINETPFTTESKILFKCTKKNKYISSKLIEDGRCQCEVDEYGLCDDEISDLDYIRKHITFPTICDGFTELAPININGPNETDETECQYG